MNALLLVAMILIILALIMIFASYFLTKKSSPSASDLKNAGNLQIAGMIMLGLAFILGTIALFRKPKCPPPFINDPIRR